MLEMTGTNTMANFLICSCGKSPKLKKFKKIEDKMEVGVECQCGKKDSFHIFEQDFLAWCNTPEIMVAFKNYKKIEKNKQVSLW